MTREGTPVEHYPDLGLFIKREDLSCPGGPNFSKTRGVLAHVRNRPEQLMGVLDTYHSNGGWAVARACQKLGKRCVLFYPIRKRDQGAPLQIQQQRAQELGATLVPLQAGRSAVLYHQAKRRTVELGGWAVPNALKLPEMITETAAEVARTDIPPVNTVLISASSGTIAAGVISGLCQKGYAGRVVVHQGYSRPELAMRNYMSGMVATYSSDLFRAGRHPGGLLWRQDFDLVDEGYGYADRARPCGVEPPCPMNDFYDRKLFSWWVREGHTRHGEALLWNIG